MFVFVLCRMEKQTHIGQDARKSTPALVWKLKQMDERDDWKLLNGLGGAKFSSPLALIRGRRRRWLMIDLRLI